MTNRKERALTAAIELLAVGGIRALTHLRVDDRAGFPRGSTSNIFRTREALLLGVCEHMVASERPQLTNTFNSRTPDAFSESLTSLFRYLVGPSRTMTAARLALIIEGSHDDEVRTALSAGRVSIENTILPALVALGAPDPLLGVQLIATCFEGLFLHVIGRHAPIDAESVITATVRAIFAPTSM